MNCSHIDFIDFPFEEQFEVNIIPLTRAILAKYKHLPPSGTPVKQERVTADTFNCKLNGTVVKIGRNQLCNNEDDCDVDDMDGHALDEKPKICQGS